MEGKNMTRGEKIDAIIRAEWEMLSENDLFLFFKHNRQWDFADTDDSEIDEEYTGLVTA